MKRTRASKRATNHFILNWNKMLERRGWRPTNNANHCPYSKLHDFGPCIIEYTYFVMTPRASPTPDGCDGDGEGDGDENSEGDSGLR